MIAPEAKQTAIKPTNQFTVQRRFLPVLDSDKSVEMPLTSCGQQLDSGVRRFLVRD
jgi:hypothetical protein